MEVGWAGGQKSRLGWRGWSLRQRAGLTCVAPARGTPCILVLQVNGALPLEDSRTIDPTDSQRWPAPGGKASTRRRRPCPAVPPRLPPPPPPPLHGPRRPASLLRWLAPHVADILLWLQPACDP